jgi:signal transduction histidine kinase
MKPLSRRGLDTFLAAFVVAQAVAIMLSGQQPALLGATLTTISGLALIGRRLQPLIASTVSLFAIGACLYVLGDAPTVVFFSLLVTFAIVAAINSTRDAVMCWVVGASLIGVAVWLSGPVDAISDFALTLGLCTIMWAAGLLLSRRTQQAADIQTRLDLTEQKHLLAVTEERSRIARELHDVVSHGLTVVIVQTLAARGVLEDLNEPDTDEADRHLGVVESAAREALADMRRMLGLLQVADDESASGSPVPRLRDIDLLCDRAQASGLHIERDVDHALHLPEGFELSIYRILQESLTNVIKHAPGASVRLRVAEEGRSVLIQVNDDGGRSAGTAAIEPKPPAEENGGRGVIGMRERVAAFGGSLCAGPQPSGGFQVRASIPVPAESQG